MKYTFIVCAVISILVAAFVLYLGFQHNTQMAFFDTETGKVDYGHSLLVFVYWFMAAFVLHAIAGCAILGISRLFLRSSK